MVRKEDKEPEPKPEIKEQRSQFKSGFKTWIRIVALIVVAVFLPEQVAQAVEYDWRVLWQKPAIGTFAPSYLKDIRTIDIPLTIRNILKDISGKPVNAIKISPNLTINLEKPLNISKQRIEEIYNWLQGKPCGAKALYEYLSYKGLSPKGTDPVLEGTVPDTLEQDVAVLALTIDILNDVVKPEGNPEVIKNSLYALSKASEFFGHKLYPVKVDSTKGLSPSELNQGDLKGTVPDVPFIAHLKGDHYILVTRITDEKVYFVDEHKEEFLPKEKFLEEFSGYALIMKGLSPKGTDPEFKQGTVPVSDAEAKGVLGARYASKYRYSSFTDALITAAVSAGSIIFTAYHPPTTWTSALLQPTVTYGITYLGQKNNWNPYLTAGLAIFGGMTAGSLGSMSWKTSIVDGVQIGWKTSQFWTQVANTTLKNAAVSGTMTGIKYYGAEHGWRGLEDLAAIAGGQAVNYGITAYFNKGYEYVGKVGEGGKVEFKKPEDIDLSKDGIITGAKVGDGVWRNKSDKLVTIDRLPIQPIKISKGGGQWEWAQRSDGFFSGAWQGIKDLGGGTKEGVRNYFISQGIRYGFEYLAKKQGKHDERLISSFGLGLSQGWMADISPFQAIAMGVAQGATSYGLSRLTKNAKQTMLIDLGAMVGGTLLGAAFNSGGNYWNAVKKGVLSDIKQVIIETRAPALGWSINNLDDFGLPIAGSFSMQGIVKQTDFLVNVQEQGFGIAYQQSIQSALHYRAVENLSSVAYPLVNKGLGYVYSGFGDTNRKNNLKEAGLRLEEMRKAGVLSDRQINELRKAGDNVRVLQKEKEGKIVLQYSDDKKITKELTLVDNSGDFIQWLTPEPKEGDIKVLLPKGSYYTDVIKHGGGLGWLWRKTFGKEEKVGGQVKIDESFAFDPLLIREKYRAKTDFTYEVSGLNKINPTIHTL